MTQMERKQQALAEAKRLSRTNGTGFSLHNVRELLITKGFTQEEADYVLEHLDVDYKQVALACAEFDAVESRLSKEKIREYLDAQGFTEEEVTFAMINLPLKDFKENALLQALWRLDEYHYPKSIIYNQLIAKDWFTEEEAQYAIKNLDEVVAEREKRKQILSDKKNTDISDA